MEFVRIELFCYKGNVHRASVPLNNAPRNGIPDRLRSEDPMGYTRNPGEPDCCYMPNDLEARILRIFESGGIDAHISYGRIRVDGSDFRYTPNTRG